MKIILLRDHHSGDKVYLAGQEIDVSEKEYEHIMACYQEIRTKEVQDEHAAFMKLSGVGKV